MDSLPSRGVGIGASVRAQAVTQCRVRTFGVVVGAPLVDDDPCFPETVEDFPIEAFIPEFAVERAQPGYSGFL